MVCILIIVLLSKFVFKAYWGDHFALVLAVLLSEVVMAVSFGLAASYLLKGPASRIVVLLVTQLASFFGGAYFPIGDDGDSGVMGFLVKLSPIRWANHALTNIIYGHQLSAGTPVIVLNLAIGVLLLAASAIMMNRKEGI
jgi:ABC-2 type transport system permease protein